MAGNSCYLMNNIADLHMHSNFSDGKYDVKYLIDNCIKENLSHFSISDHDTVKHFSEIRRYLNVNNLDIEFIPGVEFSCEFNGTSVHILGYGIDESSTDLTKLFCKINQERIDIIQEMGKRLINLGCNINYEHILENQNSPGRPHLANELVKNGYAKNFDDAFDKWLGRGKSGYLKKWKPRAEDVIKIIHNSNGIASIAHIGVYKSIKKINKILELNLDCIEAFHPDHSEEYTDNILKFCDENNLSYSGGSDFHGWGNNNSIGSYGLNDDEIIQFINKLQK
jgi:3',5'-nucleoside bisphosphate phosphatase